MKLKTTIITLLSISSIACATSFNVEDEETKNPKPQLASIVDDEDETKAQLMTTGEDDEEEVKSPEKNFE